MAPKRNYQKWGNSDLEKTIDAVRAGMTLCKAKKEFGVPKQILSDRINGRWKSTKPGRTTVLFEEEETALINYIKYMASVAHPLSVPAIKAFEWAISKRRNSKRFNTVTGTGHTWWEKFKKRHEKEITLRKPDKLNGGRSRIANVNAMTHNFSLLGKIMIDLDLFHKPDQIFKCHESGIQLEMLEWEMFAFFSNIFFRPSEGLNETI